VYNPFLYNCTFYPLITHYLLNYLGFFNKF